MGDKISAGKGFDPTLGLYAASAYADADILEEVRSVRDYMRIDLGVDLFDVAMLSDEFSRLLPREKTVPFLPMLSQGWNLLRVKGVQLAPEREPQAKRTFELGLGSGNFARFGQVWFWYEQKHSGDIYQGRVPVFYAGRRER